jgi:hypothetical protein
LITTSCFVRRYRMPITNGAGLSPLSPAHVSLANG